MRDHGKEEPTPRVWKRRYARGPHAIRSYEEVTEILRNRDGWKVSMTYVARLGRQAEEKLRHRLAKVAEEMFGEKRSPR